MLRTTFTPRNFGGLMLWLDASVPSSMFDATTGGSNVAADGAVARWEDLSGNGRHATQGTANNRPIRKVAEKYGRDAVKFDGVNDGIATATLSADLTAYSFYMVLRRDGSGGGNFGRFWSINDTQRASLVNLDVGDGTGFIVSASSTTDLRPASPLLGNAWHCLIGLWDGSSNRSGLSARLNGTQVDGASASMTVNSVSGHAIWVGDRAAGGRGMNAALAEFALFSVRHSASEVAIMEQYLRKKWALL